MARDAPPRAARRGGRRRRGPGAGSRTRTAPRPHAAWPWRSTDRGDSTRASRPRHTGARARTRGLSTHAPTTKLHDVRHSFSSSHRSCSHDISAVRSTCTKVERQRYGTVYAVVRPARSSTCACNENVSLAHSRRLEGPHRQTGRDAVMMDGVKAMRGHGPTRFPARRRAFPPPSCWLRRSL